jgi:hypothetical protein
MSFNGSGTFLINSTGQPVVANTVISATVFNALTADLASGLTNCITKDGQSTPTANIPMGSNKITGLANGTLIGDAANLGQVQSTVAKLISITGTDTVVGTMSPTLTAYAAGQLFYFIASGANTGAVTLNVDGLGAKAITRDGSTALAAGDINSGEIVVVIYDGTRFQMINAANSFGNTTINGTLTVTGNTGLQANVSVTSALSVGGTFAVTGAATLGSTLAVTGKSDLPTVSTASANAAVAVITDLSAAGASITSANVGTAVVTTGTVTNLTATSASVASVNAGVALLTTATVTNLTATGASIASANLGNAVISALTLTGVSVASANVGVANITDLRAVGASVTSANLGTAVVTNGTVTNLTATSASVASVNAGVALVTTGTVTNLTSTAASIASANIGVAAIGSLSFTGASIASLNAGVANITDLRVAGASVTSANLGTAVITTGNLTFSSTAQRITGDFSNATLSNRLAFQTSTTNGNTIVGAFPNGTGSNARLQAFSTSDPTNASTISFEANGAISQSAITADKTGTGTYLPLTFYTGGSERMRLDTAGQLGLGVVPSAWASGNRFIDINNSASFGAFGGTDSMMLANAYWNGSNWVRKNANNAFRMVMESTSGTPSWTFQYAANSTAGSTISWSEAMRIDTSGNVGIGGTAGTNTKTQISGSFPVASGNANSNGLTNNLEVPSAITGSAHYFRCVPSIAASTATSNVLGFWAQNATLGAGASLTNQYGFVVDPLTSGTNNYGFYSDIASGSNRWNFYAAGTAQNYFAGDTGVGRAPVSTVRLTVRGPGTTSGGYSIICYNSSDAVEFYARDDGLISTGALANSPYNFTTGSAANMYVDSNGLLYRSTSSLRYKSDVANATHGLADVLKLRSVTYKAKNSGDTVFGGLIAEEVHDAGLTEFVAYDKEGRPDAIHYGNMVALLVKAVQELTARVAELEAK